MVTNYNTIHKLIRAYSYNPPTLNQYITVLNFNGGKITVRYLKGFKQQEVSLQKCLFFIVCKQYWNVVGCYRN